MSEPLYAQYLTGARGALDGSQVGLVLADDGFVYQVTSDGGITPINSTTRVLGEGDSFALFDPDGNELISIAPGRGPRFTLPPGTAFTVNDDVGGEYLSVGEGGVNITLKAGQNLNVTDAQDRTLLYLDELGGFMTVYDQRPSGFALEAEHPLFTVEANGQLHGKTGKSLVFDL